MFPDILCAVWLFTSHVHSSVSNTVNPPTVKWVSIKWSYMVAGNYWDDREGCTAERPQGLDLAPAGHIDSLPLTSLHIYISLTPTATLQLALSFVLLFFLSLGCLFFLVHPFISTFFPHFFPSHIILSPLHPHPYVPTNLCSLPIVILLISTLVRIIKAHNLAICGGRGRGERGGCYFPSSSSSSRPDLPFSSSLRPHLTSSSHFQSPLRGSLMAPLLYAISAGLGWYNSGESGPGLPLQQQDCATDSVGLLNTFL